MASVAVKERPILFSGEMVRAILDGRKAMTRRIVQWKGPEPGLNLSFSGLSAGHYCTGLPSSGHVLYGRRGDGVWEQRTKPTHCPYGEAGGRLWVKETWAPRFAPDGSDDPNPHYVKYRADSDARSPHDPDDWHSWPDRWRPSIHMPRWASRITLEITGVRVERLTRIGSEDAIAEGFGGYGEFLEAFYEINKGRITYADDPWVWCISFRRVEGE